MRFALNRNVFPVTFQQPQREITIKISTFPSLPSSHTTTIFSKIVTEGKDVKCSLVWCGGAKYGTLKCRLLSYNGGI